MRALGYALVLGLARARILDLSHLDATLANETLFSRLYNVTMEWGLYKPDLYFGVRNRQDHPLTAGLFWYSEVNSTALNTSYPYVMDQGVAGHYEFHDATSASRQLISDEWKNVNYTIEFQKEIEENYNQFWEPPYRYISRWTAKVKVQARDPRAPIRARPVFFVAKEGRQPGEDGVFKVFSKDDSSFFKVQHGLGNLTWEMIELGSDTLVDKTSLKGVSVSEELTWQLDKLWRQNYAVLNSSFGLINTNAPNVVMVRPTQTADGFEFVIHYSKQQFASAADADWYTEIMYKPFASVLAAFRTGIAQAEANFTASFAQVFGAGYTDLLDTMPQALQFGREALANLFGGLGYFYGPIRIKNESGSGWYYDAPGELFTCTPSRPYFPRGFLWDEGFHSQLTCQWSKLVCMDIIAHWFNTIKPNGWIPREQMRGKEAESNLDWTLVEDPQAGNPPSFLFVLDYLAQAFEQSRDPRILGFLVDVLPRVELWFSWFNSTLANSGANLNGTFMWRDVYKEGALSSGLDDYPRGFREVQAGDVHADLQIWMVVFAKFMARSIDDIGNFTHRNVSKRPSQDYRDLAALATRQFFTWCYDEASGLYTDRIYYQKDPPLPSDCDDFADSFVESKLTKRQLAQRAAERKYQQSANFSPSQGIVNLWPVAFDMFDSNATLDSTLAFAVDEETMFSPYGLRGVSKRDIFYFPGTGYWRGPVWISVNYLVLRGLFNYFLDYQPAEPLRPDLPTPRAFYKALRRNLAQTVYDNWLPQHLFYENFNDVTGKGQYSHPFTGWTTLILLVIQEKYI